MFITNVQPLHWVFCVRGGLRPSCVQTPLTVHRFVCWCPGGQWLADCPIPCYCWFCCPCPGWAWHVVMSCDSYANVFFPSWKLFFSLSLKGWVSLCQFGHVRVFLPQCDWMRRDSGRTVADLLLWHCHSAENTCKLESPPQNVSTGTKVLVTQKKKQDDFLFH